MYNKVFLGRLSALAPIKKISVSCCHRLGDKVGPQGHKSTTNSTEATPQCLQAYHCAKDVSYQQILILEYISDAFVRENDVCVEIGRLLFVITLDRKNERDILFRIHYRFASFFRLLKCWVRRTSWPRVKRGSNQEEK